jgi:ribosomal protein S15P/S13E
MIAYLKTKGVEPKDKRVEEGQVTYYFENTNELHFYLREYKKDIHLQNFITNLTNTRKEIKSLV